MEKRRPTYDLDAVKQVLGAGETLAITTSALRDATALGFDRHASPRRSQASNAQCS